MKAFEEWDRKEYPLPPTIERGPIGRDCLVQRKHAWKSALELLLGEINGHGYDYSTYEIKCFIEKELGYL